MRSDLGVRFPGFKITNSPAFFNGNGIGFSWQSTVSEPRSLPLVSRIQRPHAVSVWFEASRCSISQMRGSVLSHIWRSGPFYIPTKVCTTICAGTKVSELVPNRMNSAAEAFIGFVQSQFIFASTPLKSSTPIC